MSAAPSKMGRWALSYAEKLGLEVFPLAVRGKEPLLRGERGLLDATVNTNVIGTWWKVNPNANIGIRPPAGVVVVDFDTTEAYERVLKNPALYPLPETVSAKTANGYHFWYRSSRPVRQAKVGPGIDSRTRDGYVVAAPSVHPSGAVYQWVKPPEVKDPEAGIELAELPEWVYQKVKAEEPEEAPLPTLAIADREEPLVNRMFSGIGEGERNETFYRYASRLRGIGVDRREAQVLIDFHHAKVLGAGFDRREAERCLESAWRHTPEEAKKLAQGIVQAQADIAFTSIEELMATDYPEMRWLVPGLITDGLTVLASSPKIGKSWLCLGLALSVSAGQSILGHYTCDQGEVLYLDLEQPPRKTQKRIAKMSSDPYGKPVAPPGGWRGVTFCHSFPRLNEGGLEALDAWLTAHPKCRLVVVDVMAKVKPQLSGRGNVYDEGYQIYSDLKLLFDKHLVAGILVTHDRKSTEGDQLDRVHGDRSVIGAADAVLVLSRQRGQKNGLLFAAGREIEDRTMELTFDGQTAQWVVTNPHFTCEHPDQKKLRDGTRACVVCGEVVTSKVQDQGLDEGFTF